MVLGDFDGNAFPDAVAANAGWQGLEDLSLVSDVGHRPDIDLELLDPSGVLLTTAAEGPEEVTRVIRDFVATSGGTYFARVRGNFIPRYYALAVTRGATFEVSDTIPQDLTGSGQVLGHVEAAWGAGDGFVYGAEDFESGQLGASWTTYSSLPDGRVQVTGEFGTAHGDAALVMDCSPGGNMVLNEAIWTVNLVDAADATLAFLAADFGDEETAFSGPFADHFQADGVAISADGTNWFPVLDAPDQSSDAWVEYEIDLVQAAADAGISLGADFRIKFQ